MTQGLRESLTYYNTLTTKRYGVYRKVDFAISLCKFVGDTFNMERLEKIKKNGVKLGLPLIHVNYLCDNVFNPDTRIRKTKGKQKQNFGLLELNEELLEIERIADAVVLKYRAELDAFISSATVEVMD